MKLKCIEHGHIDYPRPWKYSKCGQIINKPMANGIVNDVRLIWSTTSQINHNMSESSILQFSTFTTTQSISSTELSRADSPVQFTLKKKTLHNNLFFSSFEIWQSMNESFFT